MWSEIVYASANLTACLEKLIIRCDDFLAALTMRETNQITLDKGNRTEGDVADFAYNHYQEKILSYYIGRGWRWEAVGVNGEVK